MRNKHLWRQLTIIQMLVALILSACSANGREQAAVTATTAAEPTSDMPPPQSSPLPRADTGSGVEGATVATTTADVTGTAADRDTSTAVTTMATILSETDVPTTLIDITQNPGAFQGEIVQVDGKVSVVRGERAFTIGDGTLPETAEVLVISANKAPLDQAVQARAVVRVVGTVRELSVPEIERQFDFDLAPEFEVAFQSKPVIVAETIEVIEGATGLAHPVAP